jgi:hypothetical protein
VLQLQQPAGVGLNGAELAKRNPGASLQTQGVPLQADARGEYRLWQRRYWEHTICDDEDRQRQVD